MTLYHKKEQFQIIEDLQQCQTTTGKIIIIRHAHRMELPLDARQININITLQGEVDAEKLGAMLPLAYSLVLSYSGIIRTQTTAECIANGFQKVGGVVQKPFAIQSQYGSYIHSNQIYQWGVISTFLKQWLTGTIPQEILDPPHKAAHKLLVMLLDTQKSNCHNPKEKEIYLHVGHDWDIIALQYAGLNFHPDIHPVDFLEGLILEKKETGIKMLRHGHCSSLLPEDFE